MFEHFFAAAALKRYDLPVNTLLAASVEVTQIGAHQGAGSGHFSRFREQVDMEMRRAPRARGAYSPAIRSSRSTE